MADFESARPQPQRQTAGFVGKLASGGFGLAKTYWLFGVAVGLVVNVALRSISSPSVRVVAIVAYAMYEALVLLGTWHAANRYKGPAVWAVLGKVVAVLGGVGLFLITLSVLILFAVHA